MLHLFGSETHAVISLALYVFLEALCMINV